MDSPQKQSVYCHAMAAMLLVLMAVLAGGTARRESVTIDEVAHIGAGLSYVERFDLRLNEEHPPLAKVLSGISLAAHGTKADYSHVTWTASRQFLPHGFLGEWTFGEWVLERWNDPVTTLAWARLPMLLLTLVLGWVIYLLASRIGGHLAGLLCLSLYVSMPVVLTFGPLVLTDVAITLLSLLALWTFATMWQEPTRANALRFALCLAGALLSKFSAGLLFFAFGLFGLSTRWRPIAGQPEKKDEVRKWRSERWRAALKGTFWAAILVYAVYFILSWNQTTDVLYLIGHGSAWVPVRRLLMPPWLYLRGILMLAITFARPTYVLGIRYPHGVWFYFPVLFLLKSPLGFLGLLATGIGVAWTRKRGADEKESILPAGTRVHWRVLWVALVLFVLASVLGHFDVSYRHFMLPVVLMILLLAPLPRLLGEMLQRAPVAGRRLSAVTAILAVSCLFTAVRAYPYYFPYISPLGMGKPAYALASDSNVDWNQALPEARRFAEQHGMKTIEIDTYGFNDPKAAVPQAELWNCQRPTAADAGQWVIVSADMILDSHNCGWLLQYPQEVLAGGGMYAFQLPSPIPVAGAPGGPPVASAQREFVGFPMDMRVMFLDLVRNPEKLPDVAAQMQAQMQEEMKKRKGASSK
ncbi:MAG TPA: glycosyltransferase family 39 protein [Terriglobales bacterium]|nr:glycosyltransferase family 39 protein [Terriglobales bacterium]